LLAQIPAIKALRGAQGSTFTTLGVEREQMMRQSAMRSALVGAGSWPVVEPRPRFAKDPRMLDARRPIITPAQPVTSSAC